MVIGRLCAGNPPMRIAAGEEIAILGMVAMMDAGIDVVQWT